MRDLSVQGLGHSLSRESKTFYSGVDRMEWGLVDALEGSMLLLIRSTILFGGSKILRRYVGESDISGFDIWSTCVWKGSEECNLDFEIAVKRSFVEWNSSGNAVIAFQRSPAASTNSMAILNT